jgi:hypothetical protein
MDVSYCLPSGSNDAFLWKVGLGAEVELLVPFQRDVWYGAEDLHWSSDEKEILKRLSSTRVILALSLTRETLRVGSALCCIINSAIKLLRALLLEDGMMDGWFRLGLLSFCGQFGLWEMLCRSSMSSILRLD